MGERVDADSSRCRCARRRHRIQRIGVEDAIERRDDDRERRERIAVPRAHADMLASPAQRHQSKVAV